MPEDPLHDMYEVDDPPRAARYSDLFGAKREHTPDCAYCPVCTTIAVVRRTHPEILEHLSAAARELVLAAGIILEEAGEMLGAEPKSRDEPQAEGARVHHIDVG